MARLKCLCGNTLSNTISPNPGTGIILTDNDLEDILDAESPDDMAAQISDRERDVWECSGCGRLAVNFPLRSDSTVKWYKPEDGAPGNLMRPEIIG